MLFPLLWAIGTTLFALSLEVYGAVYITDHDQKMALEVTGGPKPCLLHLDKKKVDSIVRGTSKKYLQKMSSQDLQSLSSSCLDSEQVNKRGGFIFPGTKWCGPGSLATNYNDLGPLIEEDKCCREHDHCPMQLEPGQCRQGVCNTTPFTRSHCDCDTAFKKCLREVNSDAANIIGILFFNVVQVTCFTKRRTCPHYMREDPSYTWFCEEWKFTPSGEFSPTLLTHQPPPLSLQAVIHGIPDEPKNVKPALPPSSAIDGDLETLFEKDSSVSKVMANSKASVPGESKATNKSAPSVLNSIPNGKEVWRD